ncbi:uncharacterized protein AMSG_07172 [Thecamonas trahens ATCC 50062]|uniref:Uncharacterized protein n=1 Tax=Thecamonas trahens ATCC 50062 TaxID=461836 RepID=A0A0L0DFI5_THETB|nr:hypothetical protein AMSG_07172 [Thecamonas trahens ATCC 50062]KNC50926.1 hypothetical protein AMSG_07172 [Thecamonas trahens ATCC 50062]|eukprot:XP_013756625.1 hypothetical protein AMSG_07172 [Thecamonas trahens ATCC 50062]
MATSPSLAYTTPPWLASPVATATEFLASHGWLLLAAMVLAAVVWSHLGAAIRRLLGLAPRFERDPSYRADLDRRRAERYNALQDKIVADAAEHSLSPGGPSSLRHRRGGTGGGGGALGMHGGGPSYRPARKRPSRGG